MALDFKRLLQAQPDAKAFGPHRFFYDDAPVATYLPGAARQRERGILSQREANHHLQSYGGSEAVDWVMNAVGLYSDTAASAPWHLERNGVTLIPERRDDSPVDAPLAPTELVNLLRHPNPFMSYGELMELLVIDLLLVGNAYWFKHRMTADGKPLALYRLSPAHVKIKPSEDQSGIAYYEYQPPGVAEPTRFSPREVLHFKRPNPHNPYYGLGVVKGGGRPFDLEIALTDATAHYFENKADPSLIVQSERRVPRDVFNKLRAQLRARAAGAHNAGEMLVLEAGLKAMTLTPNAREAMYSELAEMSRNRILAMFRVNPKLLGMPGGAGDGQDKVHDLRREFDNKTLRPFLNKIQARVTEGLVAAWGLDFIIDYRYIMPAEEAIKLSGDLGNVPGVQVKEIRRFLHEAGIIAEVSTGDAEIDNLVLNLPGEEADEDGQPVEGEETFADRPLPGEPGRPPKGENTKPIPRGGGPLPKGSRARRPEAKALTVDQVAARLELLEGKAVRNDDNVRTTIGTRLPDEVRPDDRLVDRRTSDTDAIIASMKRDLADAVHPLERALLDHVEGKAFNPRDLTKRIRNSEAWTTFRNMVERVMQRYAEQAISTAVVHHDYVGDEIDYETLAREIVYRQGGLRSITDSLRDSISKKVQAAAADPEFTQAEMNQLVRAELNAWRLSQSETVAMTEIVQAYNEGTLAVAEAQGVSRVLVSDGDDHDEPCKEADGQVWSIAEAREKRLEHPRCRRAFVPVPATI